jgi:hypothetical protein
MSSEEQAPSFFESSVPFGSDRIRAAAVYCSDGRFGEQVDDLLHYALELPRYDRLAVPGGPACLASQVATSEEQAGVVEQLRFLVEAHGLERVILIAHQDCAFYGTRLSVSREQLETQQRDDILRAVGRVQTLSSTLAVDAFFARKHPNGTIHFESVDV